MINRPARRFTLIDAMILIASVAGGLGLVRVLGTTWNRETFRDRSLVYFIASNGPGIIKAQVVPVLAALAAGVLIAGRFPPSSPLRLWLREPGVIGWVGAFAAMAMDGAVYAGYALASSRHDKSNLFNGAIGRWADVGSYGLIASFLAVTALGRWRRPRSWVDRAGRWIGLSWIGCWAIVIALAILFESIR